MCPSEPKAALACFMSASSAGSSAFSSGSFQPAAANWPVNDQSNSATSAM